MTSSFVLMYPHELFPRDGEYYSAPFTVRGKNDTVYEAINNFEIILLGP